MTPLYDGTNRLTRLYDGSVELAKLYDGSDLIFSKAVAPPPAGGLVAGGVRTFTALLLNVGTVHESYAIGPLFGWGTYTPEDSNFFIANWLTSIHSSPNTFDWTYLKSAVNGKTPSHFIIDNIEIACTFNSEYTPTNGNNPNQVHINYRAGNYTLSNPAGSHTFNVKFTDGTYLYDPPAPSNAVTISNNDILRDTNTYDQIYSHGVTSALDPFGYPLDTTKLAGQLIDGTTNIPHTFVFRADSVDFVEFFARFPAGIVLPNTLTFNFGGTEVVLVDGTSTSRTLNGASTNFSARVNMELIDTLASDGFNIRLVSSVPSINTLRYEPFISGLPIPGGVRSAVFQLFGPPNNFYRCSPVFSNGSYTPADTNLFNLSYYRNNASTTSFRKKFRILYLKSALEGKTISSISHAGNSYSVASTDITEFTPSSGNNPNEVHVIALSEATVNEIDINELIAARDVNVGFSDGTSLY